jgi:predicted component of type VI protein secretion system
VNYLTSTSIERRTFLRGMGTTVALPFLDAMVPAGRLSAARAAETDVTRFVAIEMVHGAAGCNEWGATQNLWAPADEGRDFDLMPSALSPLDDWREYLTIVSNTDVAGAEAELPREIGGDHFRSSAVFLTQSHPKQTEGSDVFVGTSMDQIYARRFGQDTPIPSLQLCIENVDQAGGCAYGYACVYTDTVSWASATEPLPMIRDPRVAFDQLFGRGATPEERAQRRRTERSILDWVLRDLDTLNRKLGADDRARMDRYVTNLREIERRIQTIEARNMSGEPRELAEAPAGVPDDYGDHVRLMFDLQALAFASDMTRVVTFKTSRDVSGRVFPETGVTTGFHAASHHGGNPERVLQFNEINRYHMSLIPYFLEKLSGMYEGDTHLLDKTLIVCGSPMGDPNLHNHRRCPLFLAGGANGRLPKGGLHVKAPDGTPMANVLLSAMHMLGMDDVESMGNSTGDFSFTPGQATTEMESSR